jgi:NAD(P)-dependent dehydrogenase (short-subunit alcohol dehydrogenase family)
MKNALISGGTSGVGHSVVRALLQDGYQVSFIGRNGDKGRAVEAALNARHEGRAAFVQLDLSRVKNVQAFARDFAKKHDSLDLLANIAGAMIPERTLTEERLEKTFAIGYMSAFVLSTELGPLLAKARGRISNVAGVPTFVFKAKLDFDDIGFATKYSSFKTAITTVHAKTVLTEILAEKYAGQGIDVNSFDPGAVRSDLMKNMKSGKRVLFGFLNLFMAKESKPGIYVCTAAEIEGVTGKFFVKRTPRELNFDQGYKVRLWNLSETLVGQIEANGTASY